MPCVNKCFYVELIFDSSSKNRLHVIFTDQSLTKRMARFTQIHVSYDLTGRTTTRDHAPTKLPNPWYMWYHGLFPPARS